MKLEIIKDALKPLHGEIAKVSASNLANRDLILSGIGLHNHVAGMEKGFEAMQDAMLASLTKGRATRAIAAEALEVASQDAIKSMAATLIPTIQQVQKTAMNGGYPAVVEQCEQTQKRLAGIAAPGRSKA